MDSTKQSRFALEIPKTGKHVSLSGSLNFKLLLIIVGVLLVGLFTSSILVLNLQRQQLVDSARAASARTSAAIEASLEHAMLTSDVPMANTIVHSVVSDGGIERVLVLNPQGIVRISSDPLEIGRRYDSTQALCQGCHPYGGVPSIKSTIYNSGAEGEQLLTANPIHNQPQCVGCHDPQTQVLGLLMTETSMAELNNNLAASEGRIVFSTLVTFVLMALLMALALRRFVIRPVSDLAKGMDEVGSGNLDHQMPATGNDELGKLAVVFDAMRQHLKETRIENAQLYQKIKYVTVLEERERIAREIHDGLAQLVGSIRVWAEDAEMSLEERDWKASRMAIKKVEETARDAYASLREEMMGLRETIVPGQDIFPVLTEYLSRFQREWGIQSQLQIRRQNGNQDPISLLPNVEIQLLRIIQEALTNVHRHANAHHVTVDCAEIANALYISIQDDGDGFALENVPEGHLGLHIMNERAASVGGKIRISSVLGHGTRLEIELPRDGANRNEGSAL